MEKLLDISVVSDQSGVSPSALRYYEKKNLISAVARNGLRRQYEPSVLQKLALINLAKSAGFTLQEIGSVLGRSGTPKIPRSALVERAHELEQQAERLLDLGRMLRHVANCDQNDHFDCARFQKLLKVSARVAGV